MERDITLWELIQLQLPEWPWLTLGVIGFVCCGLVTPIFALCYGAMFKVCIHEPDFIMNFALYEFTMHN